MSTQSQLFDILSSVVKSDDATEIHSAGQAMLRLDSKKTTLNPTFDFRPETLLNDTTIFAKNMVEGAYYEITISDSQNFTAVGAANSNIGTRFIAENVSVFSQSSTALVEPLHVGLQMNSHLKTLFWTEPPPRTMSSLHFKSHDPIATLGINGTGNTNIQTAYQPIYFKANNFQKSSNFTSILQPSGFEIIGFSVALQGYYKISLCVSVAAVDSAETTNYYVEVGLRSRDATGAGDNVLKIQGVWSPRGSPNPGLGVLQLSKTAVVSLKSDVHSYQIEIKAQGNDKLKLVRGQYQTVLLVEGPMQPGTTHTG